MKISKKDIEHVAELARIYITDEEKTSLEGELSSIIAFADKLSKLDTTGVEPAAHAIHVQNIFRNDEVVPSYKRDELIENAPEKQAGCFAVPRIVE